MNFRQKCEEVASALKNIKVIPVLVLHDLKSGIKICEILSKNGLPAAEITFRTSAAESIIKEVTRRFPDLYVGAGTILNKVDLKRAFDAGAKFAVAPGFNPTVVKAAVEAGYPFAPGICSPSELEQAHELGCSLFKFFPAEAAGGVKMLKSIIAPYRHLGVGFLPTGGITTENMKSYLAVSEVVAVGGTWLGKAADIEAENWDVIEKTVKETVALVKE